MKITVNETQSNEIDWSKNPQLVVSEGCVVLTDKDQSKSAEYNFSGIVLKVGKNSGNVLGDYDIVFSKRVFKPFHGSITLSND